MSEKAVAVILLGGPNKGTSFGLKCTLSDNTNELIFNPRNRFRPLSIDLPKPLFPVIA